MTTPLVDIIIPVFNQGDLTRVCLESIKDQTDLPYRIILIDNASGDFTQRYLESVKSSEQNAVLISNSSNLGWVKAINQGLKVSTSPYVCIMNNDTVVKTQGWLSKLIEVFKAKNDIGLVNPRFKTKIGLAEDKPFIEIDFCRGYCILIKREVIDKIGGLDEAYGLGYYDDDDYSVRAIRAGFICVRANDVVVEHAGDSTFTELFDRQARISLHEKNKELFYKKWGRRLRLVLIISGNKDDKDLSDLLFTLARKQHIIHLWNTGLPINAEHINIREDVYGLPLSNMLLGAKLLANMMKKPAKRYDAVFIDSPDAWKPGDDRVYRIDIRKDAVKVISAVDSISRV